MLDRPRLWDRIVDCAWAVTDALAIIVVGSIVVAAWAFILLLSGAVNVSIVAWRFTGARYKRLVSRLPRGGGSQR